MKTMKKVFALALTLVMCLGLVQGVFADEEKTGYDIKITNAAAGHTYTAYQIFTGTLSGETLSDIQWGSDINHPVKINDVTYTDAAELAKALEAITSNSAQAKEVAEQLKAYLKDTAATEGVEVSGDGVVAHSKDNTITITTPATGYYLVVDKTTNEDIAPKGDAISQYILKVVGDITVETKVDYPTLDKEITGEIDNDFNKPTETPEADELSIGDTVVYTLTGTISSNAGSYNYYYWNAEDTLSKGLTLNEDSFTVKIGDYEAVSPDDYNVKITHNEKDGTTSISIALTHQGEKTWDDWEGETVEIVYSAVLNENAKVGTTGNENKAKLEYASNPNWNENGEPDKDGDGRPDNKNEVPSGETPEKEVKTYTTGLEILKVDENGNILTGAGFTIEGVNLNVVLTTTKTFKEDADGKYYKLRGQEVYTTVAPGSERMEEKTDNRQGGYVIVPPTDSRYGAETTVVIDGVHYAVASDEELANEDVTLYTQVITNIDAYEVDDEGKVKTYSKVVEKTTSAADGEEFVSDEVMVDDNGLAGFYGLGSGTYTIKETTTPGGFNTVGDIKVTITWEVDKDGNVTWKVTSGNATVDENGIVHVTVINNSGSELPSTGGIGTTLFYVIGAALIIGAGVLLVTKKRISNKD